MKRKIFLGMALLICALLLFPTVVIGFVEENMEVDKKVWNGVAWVDSINAHVGDIVRFNITFTYHKTDHPTAAYFHNLFSKVKVFIH